MAFIPSNFYTGYFDIAAWKRDAEFRAQHAAKGPSPMDWDYSNNFQNFKKLPGELRNMIWEFAIPGERVITISKTSLNQRCGALSPCSPGCYDWSNQQCVRDGLRANADVDLAVLRTCRDSRSIGLKHYKLAFELQLVSPVYYNNIRDTIAFSNQLTLLDFVSGDQPGHAEALKQLRLSEIIIQSIPTTRLKYYPAPTSILATMAQILGINSLDCWEIVGFASMKLGTIEKVVLIRPFWTVFGQRTRLDHLYWKEQAETQTGIQSFAAKWTICESLYNLTLDDIKASGGPSLPRDINFTSWQRPEVKVVLGK